MSELLDTIDKYFPLNTYMLIYGNNKYYLHIIDNKTSNIIKETHIDNIDIEPKFISSSTNEMNYISLQIIDGSISIMYDARL